MLRHSLCRLDSSQERHIRKTGLQRAPFFHLGSYAEVPLYIGKYAISQRSRLADIARAQREAQALCCGIRLVYRDMTPPHTSVVPEVMILIIIIDAQSNLGMLWGSHGIDDRF